VGRRDEDGLVQQLCGGRSSFSRGRSGLASVARRGAIRPGSLVTSAESQRWRAQDRCRKRTWRVDRVLGMTASTLRATCRTESEVSATRRRHSRLKSSTTARIPKHLVGHDIGREVEGPARFGPRHRSPRAERRHAPGGPADLEAILGTQPAKLLVLQAESSQPRRYAGADKVQAGRRRSMRLYG
jgi:hypothetical protein